MFSRSFCIWRSVSGAEAVIRWARACASVALCPDGLALARWLRCVPIGSRLRMGCAAFLPLQHSWQQGNYNQRFKTLGAFRAVGSKRSTAPTPASPVGNFRVDSQFLGEVEGGVFFVVFAIFLPLEVRFGCRSCVPMCSRLSVGCAVSRWARACASAALCSDGLALARWLRCLPSSTIFVAAGRL